MTPSVFALDKYLSIDFDDTTQQNPSSVDCGTLSAVTIACTVLD